MLINYVTLLSDSKGFLHSKVAPPAPISLITDGDLAISIEGVVGSLACRPVRFSVDTGMYEVADIYGRKRDYCRLLVRRFLERCPTSKPIERMYQLKNMLSLLRTTSLDMRDTIRAIESRIQKAALSRDLGGRRKYTGNNPYYTSYTPRSSRFSPRQRHCRRTKSSKNDTFRHKLGFIVKAFDSHVARLNTDLFLQESRDGYSYNWDTKTIEVYSKHYELKRKIDLSSVDLHDEDTVCVWGINNVFLARIEERHEETYCIKLLNKNLNFYGYLCVPVDRIRWQGVEGSNVCMMIGLPASHMVPSSNKATAYARLLSLP